MWSMEHVTGYSFVFHAATVNMDGLLCHLLLHCTEFELVTLLVLRQTLVAVHIKQCRERKCKATYELRRIVKL